jgi:hypothetical protein
MGISVGVFLYVDLRIPSHSPPKLGNGTSQPLNIDQLHANFMNTIAIKLATEILYVIESHICKSNKHKHTINETIATIAIAPI